MPRFNLDDYVQVNDRIVKFWDKYPNGGVVTECLQVNDHVVLFKAEVYAHHDRPLAGQVPLGTGHAEEVRITEADIAKDKRKQYEPNATSAVENCETSAVGRALANAGFEVSKSVASRQEMEKVARQQVKRENLDKSLDNGDVPAKVRSSWSEQAPETLDSEEARKLAGEIKSIVPAKQMGAVRLKLVGMGIEEQKTLSQTLQTMTKDQALELYSWVQGGAPDEGQTTTA